MAFNYDSEAKDDNMEPKRGFQRIPIVKVETEEDKLRLALWFIQRFDSPEEAEEAVQEAAICIQTMREKKEKKLPKKLRKTKTIDYTEEEITKSLEESDTLQGS